jgi:hypothetical protein
MLAIKPAQKSFTDYVDIHRAAHGDFSLTPTTSAAFQKPRASIALLSDVPRAV